MRRTRRFATLPVHIGAMLAVAAVVAFVLFGPAPGPRAGAAPEADVLGPCCAIPADLPSNRSVVQLEVPAIDLRVAVTEQGLDARGRMGIPDRPDVAAWYDFTARPGEPGNAVFAAHVNWHGGEHAAFSRLDEVVPGDLIVAKLRNETSVSYRVVTTEEVDVGRAEIDLILNPPGTETITLITCHGPFDPVIGEYRERLIVRGERLAD